MSLLHRAISHSIFTVSDFAFAYPRSSYACIRLQLECTIFAVKEFEDLDWAVRMRVIMGIAYCLEYMHHELNPPVAIHDVRSDSIFISDDYAAKVQVQLAVPLSVAHISTPFVS